MPRTLGSLLRAVGPGVLCAPLTAQDGSRAAAGPVVGAEGQAVRTRLPRDRQDWGLEPRSLLRKASHHPPHWGPAAVLGLHGH